VFRFEDSAKDGVSPKPQWARALDQGWSLSHYFRPFISGLWNRPIPAGNIPNSTQRICERLLKRSAPPPGKSRYI
jgi:hypothetical protein